jgi:hypothetical protein
MISVLKEEVRRRRSDLCASSVFMGPPDKPGDDDQEREMVESST